MCVKIVIESIYVVVLIVIAGCIGSLGTTSSTTTVTARSLINVKSFYVHI